MIHQNGTKRRALAASIMLLLLVGSLAGCAGAQDTPSAAPTAASAAPAASAQPSAATAAASQAPAETAAPEGPEEYTLPLTTEPVTLTVAIRESWSPEYTLADGDLAVMKAIEEDTGVSINWEVSVDHYDTIKVRMAANTLPDIFAVNNTVNVLELYQNGISADHDALIRQYAPNIYNTIMGSDQMKAAVMSEGKIYASFYADSIADYYSNPNTMYYRKDWQTKLGIPDPVTADDYFNMFLAFLNDDPNGNGERDEIPISSVGDITTFSPLGSAFGFGAVHVQNGWSIQNGKVTWAYLDPKFADYLAYLNKYYEEGIILPELYQQSSDRAPLIAANRLGAYGNGIGSCQSNNTILLNGGFIDDIAGGYTWMQPPQDDSTGKREIVNRGTTSLFTNIIAKSSQNQEIAIKWLDYIWAHPTGRLYNLFGIEGETYVIDADGKPTLTDFVMTSSLGVQPTLRSYGALAPYQFYMTNDDMKAQWPFDFIRDIVATCEPYISTDILPVPAMLTGTDLASEIASLEVETKTFTDEMFAKFIMGKEPIENYGKFIENLRSIGGDRLVEIKQQTYDSIFGQ